MESKTWKNMDPKSGAKEFHRIKKYLDMGRSKYCWTMDGFDHGQVVGHVYLDQSRPWSIYYNGQPIV